MNIKGEWVGDERIINGFGLVKPGTTEMPERLAREFEKQGLFKPAKIKEKVNVRADD